MKTKRLSRGKSLTEFVLLLVRQKEEKERFSTAHVYLKSWNTVSMYIRMLRAIYNRAVVQ